MKDKPKDKPVLDLTKIRARLDSARGPLYWKSLEELAETEEFQAFAEDEFADRTPQTLLGKEADLQFRLIQPTSVYRRVVNGEPIPQRPTLFLAEAVRQRLLGVGTQVVHDQMDGLRRGIAVGDGLDEVCKFQRRPGRGDLRKVN